MYYQLEISTYGSKEKVNLALENISDAISTNTPLLYFAPICLRYYYDSEGEQQILEDVETHHINTKSGDVLIKDGNQFKENVLKEVNKVLLFRSLGVPIEVVMPVMDHEILRPERMNTEENKSKVQKYIESLTNYIQGRNLDVNVQSSLNLFGVPREHEAFNEILENTSQYSRRNYYGESKFSISDKTFEHTIDEDYERNYKDSNRNTYYRSREFARSCVEYGLGEDRVHAIEMSRIALDGGYSGCFVKLPYGAEIDMLVFNTEDKLVVTFDK